MGHFGRQFPPPQPGGKVPAPTPLHRSAGAYEGDLPPLHCILSAMHDSFVRCSTPLDGLSWAALGWVAKPSHASSLALRCLPTGPCSAQWKR